MKQVYIILYYENEKKLNIDLVLIVDLLYNLMYNILNLEMPL